MAKSKKPGTGKSDQSAATLKYLEKAQEVVLDDSTWRCVVTMLLESTLVGNCAMNDFHACAEACMRAQVKSVRYDDIMRNIQEEGSKRGKASATPLSGAYFEAYTQMTQNEGVLSDETLAKVVKYQLAQIRDLDVQRLLEKKRHAMQEEEETTVMMDCKEAEDKKKGKTSKTDKIKIVDKKISTDNKHSADKEGSGKKLKGENKQNEVTLVTAEKKTTQLRKRGEEVSESHRLNDAPPGGPDMYIALIGFYEPALVGALVKLGVPLNAVLRVDNDDAWTVEEPSEPVVTKPNVPRSKGKKTSRTCHTQSAFSPATVTAFWSGLQRLMTDPAFLPLMNDVAITRFRLVRVDVEPDSEDLLAHERVAFDQVSRALYDIGDRMRQHINYLRHMQLVGLPEDPPPCDTELYDTMVRLVPSECATLPFVLHCMLEQVEELCRERPQPVEEEEDQPLLTESGLSHKSSKYENTRQRSNLTTSEERNELATVSKTITPEDVVDSTQFIETMAKKLEALDIEYELYDVIRHKDALHDPLLMAYGDDALIRSFHVNLPEVYVPSITHDILQYHPVIQIFQQYPPLTRDEALLNDYHVDKLRLCMNSEKVTNAMVRSFLNIALLAQIRCGAELGEPQQQQQQQQPDIPEPMVQSLDGEVTRPPRRLVSDLGHLPQPEDNGVPHTRCSVADTMQGILECREVVTLLSKRPLARNPASSHIVSEAMAANVLLQALHVASDTFNCVDCQYYAPSDALLIHCHNYHDRRGICRDSYVLKIDTPVGFRDFLSYVTREHACWLIAEEVKYEEQLELEAERLELEDATRQAKQHEALLPMFSEHLLVEGSIKDEEIKKHEEEKQHKEEEELAAMAAESMAQKGSAKSSKKGKRVEKSSQDMESTKSKKEEKGSKTKGKGKKGASSVAPNPEDGIRLSVKELPEQRCALPGEPTDFIGHDLGQCRVQLSGGEEHFFSLDGTRVHVVCREWLYGNQNLYLELSAGAHSLHVHSYVKPTPALETPFCFHVETANGTRFAFSKRDNSYPPPPPPPPPPSPPEETPSKRGAASQVRVPKSAKKDSGKTKKEAPQLPPSPNPEPEEVTPPLPEPPKKIKFEYNMKLTLPSSLYAEPVVGISEDDPFYIKQGYLTKGPHCDRIRDEDYRCYLKNGSILIFKTNGFVEILSSDGTITVCMNIRKKIPPPEATPKPVSPTRISDDNSDVDDKPGKGKKTKKKGSSDEAKKKPRKSRRKESSSVLNEAEPAKEPENTPPPEPTPSEWEVVDRLVTTPDGRQFSILGCLQEQIPGQLLLRCATDYFTGEVFTRRVDGLMNLLRPDGTMVVCFPDGTRISTSVSVEPDEIMCDPNDDVQPEKVVDPDATNVDQEGTIVEPKETVAEREVTVVEPEPTVDATEGTVGPTDDETDKQPSVQDTRSTSDDVLMAEPPYEGFVSVVTKFVMEHPNYATVRYNGTTLTASVELPEGASVRVNPEGTYTVALDECTGLHVLPEQVWLLREVCTVCSCITTSVIDLTAFDEPVADKRVEETTLDSDSETEIEIGKKPYCCTMDCWGHTFMVFADGSTELETTFEGDDLHADCSIDGASSKCCGLMTGSANRRVFVLRRDLSGQELVQPEDVDKYLRAASQVKGATTSSDSVPDFPLMQCHTTLVPVRSTESDRWVVPYREPYVLPSNIRRMNLLRAQPPPRWPWLLPCQPKTPPPGKEDAMPEPPGPTVVRVLQELQPTGASILDVVHLALTNYWEDARTLQSQLMSHPPVEPRTEEERARDQAMLRVALGEATPSAVEMLRYGQAPPPLVERILHRGRHTHAQVTHDRRTREASEREATRAALRQGVAPPYFAWGAGEAFQKSLRGTIDEADEYQVTSNLSPITSCALRAIRSGELRSPEKQTQTETPSLTCTEA